MRRDASPFSDPQTVARYTDGPPRFVPGYTAMQSMTAVLLLSAPRKMPTCSFSAPAAAWS